MDREASRRGYLLLLSNMHADGAEAANALRAMRGRVDGVLVMAPHITPESLERALPSALPAVLINAPGEVASRPSLRLDNAAGARAMVEHLLAGGYRHIFVNGEQTFEADRPTGATPGIYLGEAPARAPVAQAA